MSDRPRIERWRDRAEGESPEDRAGALFRSVRPHDPSPELEARVQAVLRGDEAPSRSIRRPLPALAAIAVFLMIAGGATAATMIYQTWVAPKEEAAERAPRTAKKIAPAPPAEPQPLEEPPSTEQPPPIVEAPPAPKKKTDPSSLALESKRIKAALDALRGGDARRALDEIALYEREHPKGLLHREALVAKVSALVALDRDAEALAILDALEIDSHPRSRELTILRGELRARADRCAEATADFERVLAGELDEKLRERAEKGLQRCRR